MAAPNSRKTLAEYCMRRLGWPVIEINIDPDQIEDRIDDAFQFFQDYHFDGIEKLIMPHQLTQDDIDNQFIPIPAPVISVTKVIPISQSNRSMGMFDIQYQMRLNDLYTFTSTSIIHYDMMMRHLALLEFEFNVDPTIEFNRHQQKLFIQMDWTQVVVGTYVMIECSRVLDPDQYPDIYNDRWVKSYLTELLRRQWGENLSKYNGIVLLGNVTLNGIEIYQNAINNLEKLEEQVKSELEAPPMFIMG